MKIKATVCIERGDAEIELVVQGTYNEYRAAVTSGPADNWRPAEGGDCELDEVLLDGKPWAGELTSNEWSSAEDALHESALHELERRVDMSAEYYADEREARE
jgi:hypothetical protein